MIALLLLLVTNSQLEWLSDRIPVVVNLLDAPDFEVREFATDFLIELGTKHLEDPKNGRFHYVYYYVNKALDDGFKGASVEKQHRIDGIIQKIRPKNPNVEKTMIDIFNMCGGSRVAFKDGENAMFDALDKMYGRKK